MSLLKFLGKKSSKSKSKDKTLSLKEQRRVMELLSREFRVVENGLDPAEVTAFLETIVGSSEAALKRLEHFASLQRLSQTMEGMVEETREVSEHIKEQAKREAEAEKAQVVEEAKRKAEEMVDQTKKSAQEMVDQTKKSCIASIESTNSVLLEAAAKAREVEEKAFEKVKEMVHVSTEAVEQNTQNLVANLTSVFEQITDHSALEPQPISVGIEEEKTPPNVEAYAVARKEGSPSLYSGKLTLAIPRATASWTQQLRERLRNTPGIRILVEVGNIQGENIIGLSLDEPVALTSILLEMPNVERVVEKDPKAGLKRCLPEELRETVLAVMLRKDTS